MSKFIVYMLLAIMAAVPEHVSMEPAAVETVAESPNYYIEQLGCSQEVQQIIYEVSSEYGIDYAFMLALAERESDFQTDCVSETNDYGLFQINECHFEDLEKYGLTDMFDVRQNTTACCIILKPYFEKYEDPHLVLMAYNFGPTGAKRCWDKGIYSSKYSRAIMDRQYELEKILEGE